MAIFQPQIEGLDGELAIEPLEAGDLNEARSLAELRFIMATDFARVLLLDRGYVVVGFSRR